MLKIGEAKIKGKTGMNWDEWYKLLDKAGMKTKSHQEIVAYVRNDKGLTGWWAQTIAVYYERSRGLRLLHQRPDGFEISATKTIDCSVTKLYKQFHDKKLREKWLGKTPLDITTATSPKSIRARWDQGRVVINFTKKGDQRATVSLAHAKLDTSEEAEEMKEFWRTRLDSLKEQLEK